MLNLFKYHPDGRLKKCSIYIDLGRVVLGSGWIGGKMAIKEFSPKECPEGFLQKFNELQERKRHEGFVAEVPGTAFEAQARQRYAEVKKERARQKLGRLEVGTVAPAPWF